MSSADVSRTYISWCVKLVVLVVSACLVLLLTSVTLKSNIHSNSNRIHANRHKKTQQQKMASREPRFRPVAMLDEWPLARPARQPLGPAQRDNVKDVLREDTAAAQHEASVPLARRDPNAQSDAGAAELAHPWNKCRIRKVEQPDREPHAAGKRVVHPAGPAVAPWTLPSAARPGSNSARGQQQQLQQFGHPLTGSSSAASSTANSGAPSREGSAARSRAHQHNQGSNWFALTTESPFAPTAQACDVGPRTGVAVPSRLARPSMRRTAADDLRAAMAALAARAGRCCGELWQASLEGHVLGTPFQDCPASGERMRRAVPFVELVLQLEDALGANVTDAALSEALGMGQCADATPVRYEHFLRLFNA